MYFAVPKACRTIRKATQSRMLKKRALGIRRLLKATFRSIIYTLSNLFELPRRLENLRIRRNRAFLEQLIRRRGRDEHVLFLPILDNDGLDSHHEEPPTAVTVLNK